MDDLPLAVRLRNRPVEKTGEKTRSSEGTKHADSNVESSRRAGPQLVGGKSQSYDIRMKRNKVYVYFNPVIFLVIYLDLWFAC